MDASNINDISTESNGLGIFFSSLLDSCYKQSTYSIAQILHSVNSYCNLYGSAYYSHSPVNALFFKRCAIGKSLETLMPSNSINPISLNHLQLENGPCLVYTHTDDITRLLGSMVAWPKDIQGVIVLPLKATKETNAMLYADTDCYGILLCIPKPGTLLDDTYALLKQIRLFFSKLLCHSVNIDKMILRQSITTIAVTSPDLQSYFHKVLHILRDKWFFEAGSAFIIDGTHSLLRLYATTGLAEERSRQDTYYRIDENDTIIQCFKKMQEIYSYLPNAGVNDSKFQERVDGPRVATCWLPITYCIDRFTNQNITIGVMRITNRIFKYGSQYLAGPLTWEDLEIIRFVTDISGVIEATIRTAQKRKIGLERTLHGVKSNVQSALTRLNHLSERSKLRENLEHQFRYYIPDSLASLKAVQFQIDNFISLYRTTRIKNERVKLYGSVLAKVVSGIQESFRMYNLPKLDITKLIDAGFDTIPFIEGDVDALIIIYWNIFDNALKYSIVDKPCVIELSYCVDRDYVDVDITSYGLEIPIEYHNWIFVEGFRCENAIRRRTIGSGIGLSQSRYLANEMGGDLFLKCSVEGKSTFTVRSRIWGG